MDKLKSLGSKVEYEFGYNPKLLESVPNTHKRDYFVQLNCPEFTSLCPITNQPDFATIYINYIPNEKLVESKSLKLYLFSFRNHGDFHENCVNVILNDLDALLAPFYIEVLGKFLPRGGISIHPFANLSRGEKYERLALHRLQSYCLQPASSASPSSF